MENKETKGDSGNLPNKKEKQAISSVWLFSVLFFVAVGIYFKTVNMQKSIHQAVQIVKSEVTFPHKIDETTIWENVEEEQTAVRLNYTISNLVNWTSITNGDFAKSEILYDCSTPAIKTDILDKGIGMEYLLTLANTSQTVLVSVSEKDCSVSGMK